MGLLVRRRRRLAGEEAVMSARVGVGVGGAGDVGTVFVCLLGF